jgi:MerR family transcriptional regulator, light-induced transcriptional regulator
MVEPEVLRIGEVSKRVGVSPEVLRAWERRYGLLQPARSAGGLRLYSPADVERVHQMRRHITAGLAPAEAAALALDGAAPAGDDPSALATARAQLREALDGFDEPQAQAAFDRLLALATVDTLLTEVVLPYLHDLGARWERGEASVAQEHFASGLLRGRLLGMARGWGLGLGPLAILACLPGEQHELGLIAFGLALRERGWRILYLGADAPLETVTEITSSGDPSLVVLSAVSVDLVDRCLPALRELARHRRVAIAGPAARHEQPDAGEILYLGGEVIAEATRLTELSARGARRHP